jgi:hypothetical protein
MGEIPFSQNTSTLACEKTFDHKPNKALGIIWYPKEDVFQFNPQTIKQDALDKGDAITKRQLFSLALKIYDPLGLIPPIHLQAKIAMQAIWLDDTNWDDRILPEWLPAWKKFIIGLEGLEEIKIQRWTNIDHTAPSELHIFCDASELAYGAVAYEVQGNNVAMILPKSRVAPSPKRALNIPRLELLSNLLASTLGEYISKQSKGEMKITIWTDSQIAQA